jgi:RNA polymerase-interacting CarD/CdnL/TRCF family regulator
LIAGSKVVYPAQGPCLIGAVVQRIIDGTPLMFYQLIVLDDGGGDLFVPVDKVAAIGIRLLMEKSEIPKLLDHLAKPAKAADSWKQRSLNNLRLFASGSAFDLAEIVESLTGLNETKALSFGEQKTLERARRLLICEIAEVTGETRETIKEQLEDALKARTREVQPSATNRRGRPPAGAQLAGDRLPADATEKRREPTQEKVEQAFSLAV